MHLPKKFTLPNIVSLATRRGVRTKAVVITMALVCTLFSGFALAGQGVSQYCSDDSGNEVHVVNSPATLNVEAGHPLFGAGPETSHLVCYSTTSSGSSDPEVTGGALALYTANPGTTSNSDAAFCYSDPAAMVKVDCAAGTNLNTSNPASPTSSTNAGGQATILGTPIPIPGTGVVAGVGCTSGTVAISVTDCAWGSQVGISALGSSQGAIASVGGTGCSNGQFVTINATGCAYDQYFALSGTGNSQGTISASGTGCALGWYAAISLAECSNATFLGISGIGTATSYGDGLVPGVAISGTDAATGRDIAISGSDDAASTVAVSGTENANGGLVSVSGTGCAQGGVAASAIECNPGEGGEPQNELVNRSDYTAANCKENTEGNLNSFISTPDPGRLIEPPVYCSGDAAMRAGGYPGAVKAYSQNETRNQTQVTMGEVEGAADSAAEEAVVLVDTIAGIAVAQHERLSDLEYSLTAEVTSLSPGNPLSNLTLCPSGCVVLATNGGSDGGDSLQNFNRHKGVTQMKWDPRKSNGHLDGIYLFNFYFATYDPRDEWDFWASSMKSTVTPYKARLEEVRTEVKPAKEGLTLIEAEPFVVRKYGSDGSLTATASLAGEVKGINAGFSISRTWNFAEGRAGGSALSNQTVYALWQGKETYAQGTVGTQVWRIATDSPVKWTPNAHAIYSCYRWDC